MNAMTLNVPPTHIVSRGVSESDRHAGALALLALKVSLAGCFLALLATLASVFLKVAGLV